MPIVYFNFSGINCTGSVAAVETAVYQSGAKHFEYDVEDKKVMIVFDDIDTSLNQLIDAIKELGFDMHNIEIIEA